MSNGRFRKGGSEGRGGPHGADDPDHPQDGPLGRHAIGRLAPNDRGRAPAVVVSYAETAP